MDFVERVRIIEQDHEPDGWPAIQTHELRAAANEIQRLREELAKREWQPIETAPKDGTSIILHIQKHNETYYDCKWGPYGFETYEWDGESYDWSPILSSASLTHWMPLPEPPKEDA